MINLNEFWDKYKSGDTYEIEILPEDIKNSIILAKNTSECAHAPYVKYSVGATLSTISGMKVSGCNSQTCNLDPICAEAAAISEWVKVGCSKDELGNIIREDINYIVVVGKPFGDLNITCRDEVFISPCGRCRQRLYEHCNGDTIIIGCNETLTKAEIYKLSDLLPNAFDPKNLK